MISKASDADEPALRLGTSPTSKVGKLSSILVGGALFHYNTGPSSTFIPAGPSSICIMVGPSSTLIIGRTSSTFAIWMLPAIGNFTQSRLLTLPALADLAGGSPSSRLMKVVPRRPNFVAPRRPFYAACRNVSARLHAASCVIRKKPVYVNRREM